MEPVPKAVRKEYLKLDEQQWEQVRIFVQEFFEQPEKASKATYKSLFKEIQGQYPCIVLSESSFKNHIALIEFLKGKGEKQAKCEIFWKTRQKVTEVFHEVLIGLPLEDVEDFTFEELIQRAYRLHPNLDLINQNRNTLARHFPIKKLKSFARAQRPADEATARPRSTDKQD